MFNSAGAVFRNPNRNGRHRRQRVVVGQMSGFVREYLGNLLYYIGSSIIRSRRNLFRRIRHSLNWVFVRVWRILKQLFRFIADWASDVWADLSNPFIKGARSVRGYRDMMEEIKDAPGRVKANRVRAFFKYGFMWNGHLIERFLSRVLPVLCLVICVFVVKTVATLPYAIKVNVGGQDVGFIDNEAVFDDAVATIKKRIIKVDDSEWEPSAVLTVSVADSSEIATQDIMANKILMSSGMDVAEATGIYIGGQFYGATTAGHLLSATIDNIIEPYRKDAESMGSDVTVRFTRNIDLVSGIFPANSVTSFEKIRDMLLSHEEGPIYYNANEGEDIEDIAKENGITVSKLKELNPQVNLSDTVIHDKVSLLVAENDFLASVKTIRIQRTVSTIGYNVHTNVSSDYNLGYYSITQYGHTGEKTTVTEIEYKNGEVVRETVIEETVTEEPQDEYIIIGTAGSSSSNVYGGSLAWPVTSFQFVSRGWISGVHSGFDIACVEGTPILAAESGMVVLSQDTNYGYGRYVIIDHGNGMQTVYGHMNTRLCSYGQYVERGQIIGLVGSTGNSTGPHLHFEVRIDGERVPAEPYLGW